MKRNILFLLLMLWASAFAIAQEQEPEDESYSPPVDETQLTFELEDTAQDELDTENVEIPTLGFRDFIRVFLFLGLVIAVIYLFFWVLRRLSGRGENKGEFVEVLASQVLRNDQTLYLVEVGEQVLLLGGGSGQLSLITEITNEDTLNQLKLKASQSQAGQGASFMTFLQNQFQNPKKNVDKAMDLSSLDRQKERLREL